MLNLPFFSGLIIILLGSQLRVGACLIQILFFDFRELYMFLQNVKIVFV